MLLIVSARLYTFDESLEEAARALGADPLTVFRDVTLPVIAPAVGAGFLFAWIRSFEDYIRALFLTGPNTDVLTIWMFSRIRQLDAPELNAVKARRKRRRSPRSPLRGRRRRRSRRRVRASTRRPLRAATPIAWRFRPATFLSRSGEDGGNEGRPE
ncbi:ABC transporter permease [Halorubrum ezzemoulense]|uniref:ABC transporter permease n=1 Tax=Halorubrum ezzemoulense TaxID=337243 RepID=UPI0023B89AB1|nr:ABC transporter permease subunit [Halorubrum ezzemoulense]